MDVLVSISLSMDCNKNERAYSLTGTKDDRRPSLQASQHDRIRHGTAIL